MGPKASRGHRPVSTTLGERFDDRSVDLDAERPATAARAARRSSIPRTWGTGAAGGSAASILDIHDTAAANVSATAYANGGSGGSNENGSVAGAAGSTTASTTLVGVGGAFGVSTAIGAGGGSVADGSGVGGGGATATTDVTAPGNATYSIVWAIATVAGGSGGASSEGSGRLPAET